MSYKNSIIYQIYPRSFKDSTASGQGDLNGVTEKLDYIKSLGVDVIWLSPFFKSPMKDFGYDVSDYCQVDETFGTLKDFDNMILKANNLNLKIIIDQVLSHTSIEHPWFIESSTDKDNPKADWYVWANAKPDGSEPNNWRSVFGGSSWEWSSRRKQYYLHNFLTSQPDLNFHNQDVQQALLNTCEFWLKKGVYGFRLDTVNFYFHDKFLRNNPPWFQEEHNNKKIPDGASEGATYSLQEHIYDKTRPENFSFLKKLRKLTDKYNAILLGEIGSDDSIQTIEDYTKTGKHLHTGYGFTLLSNNYTKQKLHNILKSNEQVMDNNGCICCSIENHDVPRAITRYGKNCETQYKPKLFKLINTFLFTIRGMPCVYQGQELGLHDANVPFEELQDPFSITIYPTPGRDGCRVPIPWDSSQHNFGFSDTTQKTWLPVEPTYKELCINAQELDTNSNLNFFRKLVAYYKQNPFLAEAKTEFLNPEHDGILSFKRKHNQKEILCLFNLTNEIQQLNIANNITNLTNAQINRELSNCSQESSENITLQPWDYLLIEINNK